MTASMPLGAATWGFIYHCNLDGALKEIADAGYRLVEIGGSPPHLDLSQVTSDNSRRIKRELDRHELRCLAINPIEMNPISPNEAISELATRQYRSALELAAELEASHVVMITGRRSPFIPMPDMLARNSLRAQLERLLPMAERLGVRLNLEPVPFGFLQTATEVAAFADEFGLNDVGIALDCANLLFAGADPAAEARAVAGRIALVHISDTWGQRFAHTQVGRGEIDFASFAEALVQSSYAGPAVYELVDGEDPGPRLRADWDRLSEWGWCP
jgi:sugar phosphate isomerase/epimerase